MEASTPPAGRRLTALLHADVAGYSRQMGTDEPATHASLRACFALAADTVAAQGGRVVSTAGDAFLAEFQSLGAAVDAAIAFQAAVARRNAGEPPEARLHFRVGIHLGDVIVDGDDIYGSGVNVAARLQGLAEPDGIGVSGAVRDELRSRPDLVFDDLGLKRAKNIAEPIHVFALRRPGGSPSGTGRQRRRSLTAAAAAALVACLVGLTALLVVTAGWPDLALLRGDRVSGRPTVAVLPFDAPGAAADEAYFSAGVTEDVIAQLGRFPGLLVLSWNAVAPYRDEPASLERLREALGVRYVVRGSIRRGADRVRVSVEMSDAVRGLLLWSERYDRPIEDLFALQEEISRSVAAALAVRLTRLEEARANRAPSESLGAYELVLRGRDALRDLTRSANLRARAFFEQAIALDPTYADAHVGLGWTHMADLLWGWSEWPDRSHEQATTHAARALGLDTENAQAHALSANLLRVRGELERAEDEIVRALELNPNDALSHAIHGSILIYRGDPATAIPPLELAHRLDPVLPVWTLTNLAEAYYLEGRYADAVALLTRPDRDLREDPAPHALLAASLARLGRDEEARRAAETVRRLYPFFDASSFAASISRPPDTADIVEGLAAAGLE